MVIVLGQSGPLYSPIKTIIGLRCTVIAQYNGLGLQEAHCELLKTN